MGNMIGVVFGLAAFVAVIALGLAKGVSFTGCVARALVALVVGTLVGRLIFGWPGLSIVKEAAGTVPPQAPAPGDSKPVGVAPAKVS